jgi:hypothetical protein
MSYEQAIAILAAVRAGDKSPTILQITTALTLTGDLC